MLVTGTEGVTTSPRSCGNYTGYQYDSEWNSSSLSWSTRRSTTWRHRMLYPVYTIKLVVKPVVQPVASCKQTFNQLFNRFDNRLYCVNGVLDNCQLIATTKCCQLRSSDNFKCTITCNNSRLGDEAFAAARPRLWNSLPTHVRRLDLSLDTFRHKLKAYLTVRGTSD